MSKHAAPMLSKQMEGRNQNLLNKIKRYYYDIIKQNVSTSGSIIHRSLAFLQNRGNAAILKENVSSARQAEAVTGFQ